VRAKIYSKAYKVSSPTFYRYQSIGGAITVKNLLKTDFSYGKLPVLAANGLFLL